MSAPSLSHTAIFQRPRDPVVGGQLLAVDAVGIPLQQHRHTVPESPGSLSGRDTSLEHQRGACMPEIVRAPDERGRCLGWRERYLPCGSPHLRVGGLLQGATAATLEYPVLSFHSVAIDVFAKNADECWRDRHAAHLVS